MSITITEIEQMKAKLSTIKVELSKKIAEIEASQPYLDLQAKIDDTNEMRLEMRETINNMSRVISRRFLNGGYAADFRNDFMNVREDVLAAIKKEIKISYLKPTEKEKLVNDMIHQSKDEYPSYRESEAELKRLDILIHDLGGEKEALFKPAQELNDTYHPLYMKIRAAEEARKQIVNEETTKKRYSAHDDEALKIPDALPRIYASLKRTWETTPTS